MQRLHRKYAIVTGAAGGIGFAIAKKFLQEGAEVLLCDINAVALEAVEKELGKFGPVQSAASDISRPDGVQHIVDMALEHSERIDVLVNNAGIAKFEHFIEIEEASWDRMLSVNLKGTFLLSQAVSKVMIRQRSGSIVNMSSTNGIMGEAALAHYNASKAGIILLTRTMAIELGPHQIRVNAVCPGFIATDLAETSGMTPEELSKLTARLPLGRRGTTEEVANAFAFLASDEASFITGTELVVDGGQICQQ